MTILGRFSGCVSGRSFLWRRIHEAKAMVKAVRFFGVRLSPTMPRIPETLIIRLITIAVELIKIWRNIKKKRRVMNDGQLCIFALPTGVGICDNKMEAPIRSEAGGEQAQSSRLEE
jgi:hypothetical protein